MRITTSILAITLLATAASAATINFDTRSGSSTTSTVSGLNAGNVYTYTSGGVTMTMTAWSLTGPNSTFQASTGYRWSLGMGICSATEGLNCPSPEHQVDNNGGVEFFLVQFSAPVDPLTVRIQPAGSYDTDVTYYVGSTVSNLNLGGKKLSDLAGLGFGSANNDDASVSSSGRTVAIAGNAPVTSMLFGARVGGDATPDYFKVAGVSVDCTPSAVPEPATYALIGSALFALSFARRKSIK